MRTCYASLGIDKMNDKSDMNIVSAKTCQKYTYGRHTFVLLFGIHTMSINKPNENRDCYKHILEYLQL